jgi:AraC-like DNA-binding protein
MTNMQIWKLPPALKLINFSPHHRTRKLRWHHHAFYELGLLLHGRCDWLLGPHRRLPLRPGEAILLRPMARHYEEIKPSEEARVAWIGFDWQGPPPAWCHRAIALEEDMSEIINYFHILLREHHLVADPRSQMRIDLALQSLLLLIERRAEKSPHRVAPHRSTLNSRQADIVESAALYFRRNLQDPLSIAQVAAYHSLCPSHFSSLFRRHFRITPQSFLHQAQLQQVADLLTESDMTLKEIASQCGFVDASHLCKSFKRLYRTTPRDFRRKTQKSRPVTVVTMPDKPAGRKA